ncbi:protein TolR [Alphaproteobacteria bacterium]|jgi:biopolymer transport protein TolR|nr:protein TolR [Alphaproteobacteria bacterium]MDA9055115.1 protein TolR [Alphaproteobacteria bacterium]MDA9825700.1 protein TolR [Alphaproteobacteria bacterium]MDB4147646.1 protein TolR [Alphaproteobacteria bacterium]MDG2490776.1 protein TolR [Alphaproteobacteria bacterium]
MGAGVKRSTGGRRHRPMGEINVTPFVDVMLVLLIVFMVTAPLLTVGVEVDLPKTKAGAINADAAPLVVSIKADGSLYLQEAAVDAAVLIPRLKAISNANPDVRIFVRGDRAVTYGDVLGVMGRIQAAGFEKVALVAQLPDVK